MKQTVKQVAKLRGRSFDELRVRGAQTLAAHIERRGWSAQTRVPDDATLARLFNGDLFGDETRENQRQGNPAMFDEALLNRFRTCPSSLFFASFGDHEETLAAWHHYFGAQKEDVIKRADKIAAGRFDLLGFHDLDFGDPIDWHAEPVAGKRTQLAHWSRIAYLDPEVAGDKKITWELNRHCYFTILGKAYWLTGDEHYAEVFTHHLAAWMDANPPKQGINWASNLEVAFRAIAWLWALHFFKHSPSLTAPLFTRALKFLYLHACHLETYLSTYFSPNTHLTGEALGLFYLGSTLTDFRAASRWRATGERILLDQLEKHVRPDGVYFEQTSYYHRYTTDFYTHFCILKQARGETIKPLVTEKLTALLDHLTHITRPDGTTPFYGDDDGGRLVMLDNLACNNFRQTLAVGAALLSRADYKYVAATMNADARPTEGVLWLLSAHGLKTFDDLEAHPPAAASRSFDDGGYYIMRDSWESSANYMLIDCGLHGAHNCGHAHADALAFELAAHGRTMLVDAGTYTYTGSSEMRDAFRSSLSHNTLTLDGESSSVPASAFQWQSIARCRTLNWMTRPRFDFFEGTHDGYERLSAPATHTRAVLFLKNDYWIMRDRIISNAAHRYDVRLHFAPDAAPVIEAGDDGANCVREMADGNQKSGLDAWTFDSVRAEAKLGAWADGEAWVSSCYGTREKARVMCATGTTSSDMEATDIITLLIPRPATSKASTVRARAAEGGYAFDIDTDDAQDALLIRHKTGESHVEARIQAANITSDFMWTWMRAGDAKNEGGIASPRSLVLINGSQLVINGQQLFRSESITNFFTAERRGDTLFIDTDARGRWHADPFGARRMVVNDEVFTEETLTFSS